ncbi:MAG: two-component system sensor histidine kinase CreC [Desulfovibrio sp.]|jgi:two-component system sensor histidine kinase CreC|nr:two-component system sensor histidine kinase CreC [Desulfovibrio sp.]
MTLRLRIILTFALLMALAFSGIIWLIINDVRPRYLEAVEESTVDTAEIIAAMLSRQITEDRLPVETISATMEAVRRRTFAARIYNIVKRNVSLRIYVTDARGILLYDSTGMAKPGEDYSLWRDVYLTLRGQYGARSTRTIPDAPSSQVIFVAAPILKNGKTVGVVSVGKPTNSISFLIAIAQKRFLLSLILIAAAAIALSVGLSCWITRPVKRLTQYATAIRKGEAKPLPALESSEIRDLGAAMEEMQTKLEGKNYIEDYVRALTHELKSPLTGIKGAGEILHDHVTGKDGMKFLNIVDTEVDRLHSLVDRMLQLSRLENVRAVNKTKFRAAPFFQAIADSFQTHLAAGDLRLKTAVPEDLVLDGDEFLLRQAVDNLIANAIDFSPQGSTISITAVPSREAVSIIVRDQGCGMPDFAFDKAFSKFFSLSRPGTGKKSTGLGLPFVAEVLSLHGGTVRLANAEPGLEATITLPA